MRYLTCAACLTAGLLTATAAVADEPQSGASDASLADSAKAVDVGVRVTAAVVALPLRIAADAGTTVLKQTFVGAADGSRADPFAGTALRVDDEVVVKPQPAPVVPRQVPNK